MKARSATTSCCSEEGVSTESGRGRRRLFLGALCFGVLLLFSGCGESKPSPGEPPHEAMFIDPGKAVGPVKAGMTVKEVIALLGEPQFRTQNALEYKNRGFAVMPDSEGTVQVVMCGDVMGLHGPLIKNFNGHTKEGIGLLSTGEEVLKAYGQPSKAEAHPGGRQSYAYDKLGITFSIESGKVHHMIVRLGEQFQPTPDSVEIAPSVQQ